MKVGTPPVAEEAEVLRAHRRLDLLDVRRRPAPSSATGTTRSTRLGVLIVGGRVVADDDLGLGRPVGLGQALRPAA